VCTKVTAQSDAVDVLKAVVNSNIGFEHTEATDIDDGTLIKRADTALLEYLNVRDDHLTGTIPDSIGAWTNI